MGAHEYSGCSGEEAEEESQMTVQAYKQSETGYEARGMTELVSLHETYIAILKLAEFVLLPHNLSLPQLTVLSILKRAGGILTTEEIDRATVKGGHTTRLVDRLEAGGLVERQSHRRERRGTWVRLTEDGESRLHEAMPVASRLAKEIACVLTDTRVRELGESLGLLRNAATERLNEALGNPRSGVAPGSSQIA
jgi:DNA-binding MarR family transcriptional regulator